MRITKLIAFGAIGLTVVSCGQSQVKTKKALTTDIDSVSYALGLNMAEQFNANVKEIDSDVFIQGYLNGKDSANLLLEVKDVRKVLDGYFKKKQAKELEEKHGAFKTENEKFIAENKTKEGIKTTESGLQYLVLEEGDKSGVSPTKESKVKVHYHGTLVDGTVFDSSVDRGEPSEFGVGQVIKGWTEGLQLMKIGAKYKFFIPQELAYGAQERGPKIKPFSALIFEVELLEIK